MSGVCLPVRSHSWSLPQPRTSPSLIGHNFTDTTPKQPPSALTHPPPNSHIIFKCSDDAISTCSRPPPARNILHDPFRQSHDRFEALECFRTVYFEFLSDVFVIRWRNLSSIYNLTGLPAHAEEMPAMVRARFDCAFVCHLAVAGLGLFIIGSLFRRKLWWDCAEEKADGGRKTVSFAVRFVLSNQLGNSGNGGDLFRVRYAWNVDGWDSMVMSVVEWIEMCVCVCV